MPRTAELPRVLSRVASPEPEGRSAPRTSDRGMPDRGMPDRGRVDRADFDGVTTSLPFPGLIARPVVPQGHLACPSPRDPLHTPLTQQVVTETACSGRQGEGYHKCAACEHFSGSSFRGKQLRPENGPGTLERSREAGA